MGRFTMLMVGAVLLGVSYLLFSGQRTSMETRDQQNDYQFQSIARDNVKSGFDRGVSAIKRDLMNVDSTFPRATMDDGYYDMQVTKNLYGDLDLSVNAFSGGARYDMSGKVLFLSPFPAAVMLEDDGIVVSGSGFYQISGVDRRMPSQGTGAGFYEPVRGIMTTASHLGAITGALQMNQVVGTGSQPGDPVNQGSVVDGFDEVFVENLYQEAKLKAHNVLSADPSGNVSESSLISAMAGSSPGNPQIVRALGNVSVTGSLQGYGMLIVEDGDLKAQPTADFDWEGLIMIRKEWKDTLVVDLSNASVYGSLIAYDHGAPPQTVECPADFTIDGDQAVVNDSFTVSIEVLGAAITAGGAYDMPVTARINIDGQAYEPWGDYDLALDGNVNTGNSGVTYLWEPTTVFPAGSVISIDGRSWELKEGEDGDVNADWQISMEEHSSVAGPQIYLLKDQDPVPSVGGFMGQYSVEEFLEGYIENDQLVLDADQAVSLFELGTTDTGDEAFDLQDLVVMVSMKRAGGEPCYVEGAPSMLDVAIKADTQVHYSSEALGKLGLHLDTIRNMTRVRVAQSSIQGTGKGETLVYEQGVENDDNEGADPDTTGYSVYTVCHNGKTKTIPEPALPAHISHGDYMGSCN